MKSINNQLVNGGGRAIGLDLMRISMALLIFMFHSRIHVLHCSYGILNDFVDMGAIAMTGFFLLSGYVINLTYSKVDMSESEEVRKFYLKRLITIIPLYFAWALFHIIANIALNGKAATLQELVLFPVEALGIQSVYSSLFSFSHNGGSWFISCILICYFVYPLFHNLTKEISDKSRIITALILCFILLWSPFVQHYFHLQSIYSNPFFRTLEFSIGILISQMNLSEKPLWIVSFLRKPIVCICTLIGLIAGVSMAKMLGIPRDYMLYSWIALPCFISLMVSLSHFDFKRLKNSKMIKYLSEISFCIFLGQIIYVWPAVNHSLIFIGSESNVLKIVLSFIVVFGIANALHYFVEVPSSRYLKQRLLKK